ncbi:MAG: hypothetical protein JXP34_05760 [Planctomycetes bacterium]|nr:hypothetical protein [Planctomycetota bacterium]
MDRERWDDGEPLLEGGGAVPPGAWSGPGAAGGFRDALLARTLGAVRARVRRRRAAHLVIVLLAYAAGAATVHVLTGSPGAGGSAPRPAISEPAAIRPAPTPDDLVRLAVRRPAEEKAGLLRTAGDRYLSERGDIEAALGCYRRSLDSRPSGDSVAVEPGDNWLLIALKQSRRARACEGGVDGDGWEKEGGRS